MVGGLPNGIRETSGRFKKQKGDWLEDDRGKDVLDRGPCRMGCSAMRELVCFRNGQRIGRVGGGTSPEEKLDVKPERVTGARSRRV